MSEAVKGQLLTFTCKQLVASTIGVKPFLLWQHFLQQGHVADVNRVEQVNLLSIRVQSGRVVNELSFLGASFIEGFLSVYGLELERAVKRYEEKYSSLKC